MLGEREKDGLDTLELIGNIKQYMLSYLQPQKLLDALSYIHWLGYEEDKGVDARL